MYDPKDEAAYKRSKREARQAARRAPPVAGPVSQGAGGDRSEGPMQSGLDCTALDCALRQYPGSQILIRGDAGDTLWYKLALRAAPWPRHYLIVSVDGALSIAAGLALLDDKVSAFLAGHLRPSPD